jgi:general nucleoside transport system permease protein
MTTPVSLPEIDTAGTVTDRQTRITAIGSSIAAVLGAFIVGGVLLLLAGANPLRAYADMISGTFGSRFDFSLVLVETAPLLLIGLGLVIAFRAKVWNIGAEGQFLMGALAGGAVAINVAIDTTALVIALSCVVGAIAGAAWGGLVGAMKARWGVNEVISSLLLNYVAIFGVSYAIRKPLRDPAGFQPVSATVPDAARLPDVPGLQVHIGLLIGLVAVPLVAYVIRRTPFGFHTLMMGLNREAADAAGVRTGRLVVAVMLASGAFAGLAGVLQVMGPETRLTNNISPGFGFTAIIVALIARLRPLGVLVAALLIGVLTLGGDVIQRTQEVPRILTLVIQALFVLFLLVADKLGRR